MKSKSPRHRLKSTRYCANYQISMKIQMFALLPKSHLTPGLILSKVWVHFASNILFIIIVHLAQRSASAATTTTVQQQSVMTDNSTSSTTKKSSTKSKGSNKNKRVYYDASQDVDIFASTGTSISSTAPSTTSLTAQLSSTKTRKNSIEAGLFPKVSQAPKDIPLDTTERDDASSASSGSGDSTTSQSNGASMLNQPSMDAVAGKSSLKRMRLDSPLDSSVSSSQSSLQKPNQGETAPAATINPAQLNNNDPIMDLVHQPKRQKRKSVSWKPDSQLVRYYYIETRAEQKMQRQQPRNSCIS